MIKTIDMLLHEYREYSNIYRNMVKYKCKLKRIYFIERLVNGKGKFRTFNKIFRP